MKTMDAIFYREFHSMMSARRSLLAGKHTLYDIPVPRLRSMITNVPKGRLGIVKKVNEKYFSRLNDSVVELIRKTSLKQRKYLSDGSFMKENGEYVYRTVTAPKDSIAVFSDISIGLKNYEEVNGVKQEYKPSDGFAYVDYVQTKKGRRYIYILPRKNVYMLNTCALVLTPHKRKVYYKGYKLALQNGVYVYLYVVPFSHRILSVSRLLGIKPSLDFEKEVKEILNYWMRIGVIFDLNITALEEPIRGISNLGIEILESTCDLDEFVPYTVSLAEKGFEEEMI